MVDIVYEDPTTLEAAALDLGLEIQTAGPFSRAGGWHCLQPGSGRRRFFRPGAGAGFVSDLIDLGLNACVMLRVLEHGRCAPRRWKRCVSRLSRACASSVRERRCQRAEELLLASPKPVAPGCRWHESTGRWCRSWTRPRRQRSPTPPCVEQRVQTAPPRGMQPCITWWSQ